MTAPEIAASPKQRIQILPYLILAMLAGTTAGMLRALSPVFAIHLGATPFQIGIINSLESLGMAAMTLPAGVLVSRYGAKAVYVAASVIITSVYCIVPWSHSWMVLAIGLGIGGACMPFRIVSVSGSFLDRLKSIGHSRAGWYSGAGTVGMLLVGPTLATLFLQTFGAPAGYLTVSILFACMGIGGTFVLSSHTGNEMSPSLGRSFLETARLLRHPVVSAICIIEVSTGMVFAFFSAFIIVTAIKTIGLSEPAAISVRLFEGMVAVGTMFIGGMLVKNRPLIWFYRVSLVLIVGGFVLLGLASTYAMLVGATVLLGCGLGMTGLINIMRMSMTDVAKSRVSSLQLFSSMSGGFAGALLGGLLSKVFGLQGMFFCGAVLYAILAARWCLNERAIGS